jgi:presenilin-like A22 family membrane protease
MIVSGSRGKESLSLIHRIISAILATLVGGFVGMAALYSAMLLVGSDFGLDNVRPGVAAGALVGFVLGLCFPRRWSWRDFIGP